MTGLQLWRADTRGQIFARQSSAASAPPVTLTAGHRDAKLLQWHRVLVRGQWLRDSTILLDNKVYQQQVGYDVVTALRLEGSSATVLVNRGWVAAPRLRTQTPVVVTPTGVVEVVGIARTFEDKVFELGDSQPQGMVWQHLREADYRARSGYDVLPFVVLQTDEVWGHSASDGLVRHGTDSTSSANPTRRHYAYACLWFVFALMCLAYGFVSGESPER